MKLLLIALLACLAVLQSNTAQPRIKKIVSLKSGNTSEYYYNSRGLLDSVVNAKAGRTTCTYIGTRVIWKTTIGNYICDTFYLNDRSLATEAHAEITRGTPRMEFRTTMTYNAEGFMTKSEQTLNGRVDLSSTHVIEGGNVVRFQQFDDKRQPMVTIHYTYYPNTVNTIGYENMGMGFRGRESRELKKSHVSITPAGDTGSISYYRYTFDSQNRVATKVGTNKSGVVTDSTGYWYY